MPTLSRGPYVVDFSVCFRSRHAAVLAVARCPQGLAPAGVQRTGDYYWSCSLIVTCPDPVQTLARLAPRVERFAREFGGTVEGSGVLLPP